MASVPTPLESRELRKIDRRRSILETAARLFAEFGYTDCDMERVSSGSKIAKGTLYLYFPTKQELFLACVDWGMSEMQRVVIDATQAEVDPFGKIAQAIRVYLEFFDQNPHFVELLIQERAMFRERKRGAYFEHRESLRDIFRVLYQQLVSRGTFRSDLPVERLLDSVGALLYGTMLSTNAVGRAISLREQYLAVMQTAFGGIVTPEGQNLLKQQIRPSVAGSPDHLQQFRGTGVPPVIS